MTYKMSQSDFARLLEKCKDIREEMGAYFSTFYPKKEDLNMMMNNIDTYFTYLVFNFANNDPPQNIDETISLNMIRKILIRAIHFSDGIPECLEESPYGMEEVNVITADALDEAIDSAYEESSMAERERMAEYLLDIGKLTDDEIMKVTRFKLVRYNEIKANYLERKRAKEKKDV